MEQKLEERPPCDSALKALFATIPTIFPKEDEKWAGATKKFLRRQDDRE